MKLSVATNYEDALIEELKNYPEVEELYGQISGDIVGGNRPRALQRQVSKRQLARHVALARRSSIEFNYVLNPICLGNMELTKQGQRAIRKHLDWIASIGITRTTVAHPFLLRTIKKSYPHFRVRASVLCQVNNLRKAKHWEDEGADVIALDVHTMNREFELLRQLRNKLTCGLELLITSPCQMDCIHVQAHAEHSAHDSRGREALPLDWCAMHCMSQRLVDPSLLLRAGWVRPEDIHHYEDIGYHNFKLTERSIPTDELVKRVKAYCERRFDGNFYDLFKLFGFRTKSKQLRLFGLVEKLPAIFGPPISRRALDALIGLVKTWGMTAPMTSDPIYIDNRALDGFIDHFRSQSCENRRCGVDCGHCDAYTKRAVRIDPDYKAKCLAYYEVIADELYSGAMLKR